MENNLKFINDSNLSKISGGSLLSKSARDTVIMTNSIMLGTIIGDYALLYPTKKVINLINPNKSSNEPNQTNPDNKTSIFTKEKLVNFGCKTLKTTALVAGKIAGGYAGAAIGKKIITYLDK